MVYRFPDVDLELRGSEEEVLKFRRKAAHLHMLAARAMVYCPKDLADALCEALCIRNPVSGILR